MTIFRRVWKRATITTIIGFIIGVGMVSYLQSKPVVVKNYDACVTYGFPVSGSQQKVCTAASQVFQGPYVPYVPPVAISVPFQTISALTSSSDYPEKNDVFTNPESWQTYWNNIHRNDPAQSRPVLPAMDFSRNVIVSISEGPHRSKAVGVQITSVKSLGADTTVSANVIKPGETCSAEPNILNPITIIAFAKPTGKIKFNLHYKSQQCI